MADLPFEVERQAPRTSYDGCRVAQIKRRASMYTTVMIIRSKIALTIDVPQRLALESRSAEARSAKMGARIAIRIMSQRMVNRGRDASMGRSLR
jgi:hypothetical protein